MVSILVGVYQEESIIEETFRRLTSYMDTRAGFPWEVVFVDDGSRDGTGRLLDALADERPDHVRVIHHARNYGQGRALRTAASVARGDVFVSLDADLSYGESYIGALVQEMMNRHADIALASPYMKGGVVRNVPWLRRVLSRYGNMYLSMLSTHRLSTTTSVVRAYRREVIELMNLTSEGSEITLEILMKAQFMGYSIVEIPARLEWPTAKQAAARDGRRARRRSKMRILNTCRRYFLYGLLFRPEVVILLPTVLFLLGGAYLLGGLLYRWVEHVSANWAAYGFFENVVASFGEVFQGYFRTVFLCSAMLFFGIQMLIVQFLAYQSRFYFEQLFRCQQGILRRLLGRRGDALPPGTRAGNGKSDATSVL